MATYSLAARQAMLDAGTALLNVGGAGAMRGYSGAAPASPTDAPAGTLLTTLALSVTAAAGTDGSGNAIFNTIADDLVPSAAGTIGFFRFVNNAGIGVIDVTVGLVGSGADMEGNTLSVQLGVPVRATSFTLNIAAIG